MVLTGDDDEVVEKETSKRWVDQIQRWIREKLPSERTMTTSAVATMIALFTWVAYRKLHANARTRKALTGKADNNNNNYASAAVAPLSLLLMALEEGRLQRALLGSSRILFQTASNDDVSSGSWKRVDLPANETLQKEIFAKLSQSKTKADISVLPESDYSSVANGILVAMPFVYLALVYRLMRNQLGGGDARNNKQVVAHQAGESRKTFADVAGLDSAIADVAEIVQYLRHPAAYQQLGAKAPCGVLLYGPPGTGKTLLAQAVAGEAGCTTSFLACSASDFVELYVGRGAARVRALFRNAREQAIRNHRQRNRQAAFWRWFQTNLLRTQPKALLSDDKPCCSAILFIDELDALAKTRSSLGNGNDEREQTLNQLLTEMDGFASSAASDENVTVIVMAASNRADVLDPAILRRFDRQIHVGYPDAMGREAILRVHARHVPVASATDWKALAADENTGNMSGSDLRNLINEAALLAVREGSNDTVTQKHLEHAARRIRDTKGLNTGNSTSPRRYDDAFRIPNLR